MDGSMFVLIVSLSLSLSELDLSYLPGLLPSVLASFSGCLILCQSKDALDSTRLPFPYSSYTGRWTQLSALVSPGGPLHHEDESSCPRVRFQLSVVSLSCFAYTVMKFCSWGMDRTLKEK